MTDKDVRKKEQIVNDAFNKIAVIIELSQLDKQIILSKTEEELNVSEQIGYCITSPTFKAQTKIITIYGFLCSMISPNDDFIKHWFNTDNEYLRERPLTLCHTEFGRHQIIKYLSHIKRI